MDYCFPWEKLRLFSLAFGMPKKNKLEKKRRFIAVSVNFGQRTLIRPLLRGCLGVGSSRQPLT